MKPKMCPCGKRSVPGLISSVALCQRHYNALMFGSGEEHREGVALLQKSKEQRRKSRSKSQSEADGDFMCMAHNLMPQLLEAVELIEDVATGNSEYDDLSDRAAELLEKLK